MGTGIFLEKSCWAPWVVQKEEKKKKNARSLFKANERKRKEIGGWFADGAPVCWEKHD